MKQFDLSLWLKNKSRKVVTRQGNPVRIICTDRKHTQNWPIVALESYNSGEFVLYADDKGRTDLANENIHDLFFADEENTELTEFDYAVLSIISDHNSHTDSIEAFAKRSSKKLLAMARKEMMKDAVDGEVVYSFGTALEKQYKVTSERIKMDGLKLGDKVKIIIIKPEQQ